MALKVVCPDCQGLPVRYKLIEDKSLVVAHKIPIMCRTCNGEGQVEKDYLLDSFIDKFRFLIRHG